MNLNPRKQIMLSKNAIWILRLALKNVPGLVLGVIVFSLIASVIPAALAWAGRELINAIVATSDFNEVGLWLFIGLLLASTMALFKLAETYASSRLNQELQYIVDEMILKHVSILHLAHFEDPKLQDMLARAQFNMGMHVARFVNTLFAVSSSILQAVSITVVLVAIDPVALVMLPFVVPHLWFQVYLAKLRYSKEYSRASQRRWTKYFAEMLMSRDSVPEVKIYKLAPVLIKQFSRIARDIIHEDQYIFRLSAVGNLLLEILFQVVYYGVFAYAAWRVFNNALTVGDLVVYIGATSQLRQNLQTISKNASSITEDMLYTSNLRELLDVKPKQVQGFELKPSTLRGEIRFEDVSFTYPETTTPILKDISFHIKPGETIAIVGENGAGKSTLVKLIARLYDPLSGCIFFDDHRAFDLNLDYFHRRIAYVPQVFNRYEANVSDNIAFGDWDRLEGNQIAIREVARLAEIEEMIEDMPQTYDTKLGRRFGEYDLSIGQWQRVAISRAFARQDAKILILDEPTASLDAQAEFKLFSKIRELAAGRTTIFVSHRFMTVRMADRILVMHQGQIVEEGSHEELILKDGYYAKLHKLQNLLLT